MCMATLSLDLRQRILTCYDKGEGTREQIALRFKVSLGMVKKLLQQRRRTGCIKDRHHLAGRKKTIVTEHRIAMRQHLKARPDMTLEELRAAVGLKCTLVAIHYVLADMGLTYKKRHSGPPSRTGPTSGGRGGGGAKGKGASSPGGSSSSMKAVRRPT